MAEVDDEAYKPLINMFLRIQIPTDVEDGGDEINDLISRLGNNTDALEEGIIQLFRKLLSDNRISAHLDW